MRLLRGLQRCMRIEVDAPNTKNKGEIHLFITRLFYHRFVRGSNGGVTFNFIQLGKLEVIRLMHCFILLSDAPTSLYCS